MFGSRSTSLRRLGATTATLIVLGAAACENPQPPTACGAIPQVTVNTGETATASACFNDPNGDMLTYSATSSNPSVATASISGASITVRAVAPGNASVTVTASDPGGLQGQQSFQVTVPNRPPLARGAISAITVQVGETESVDVSSYFAEPDGEALTYAAASSRPGVATVSVSGSTVRVAAVAKGTATVTVTATDPGGLSATQVFETMVPNRRPEPVGTISDQTVEVGDPVTVNLSSYFNDPDGDPLTYTARSSVSAVAAVSVSGSTVTITARAKGTTDVTITATDTEGLSGTQRFRSTVPNRAPVPEGTVPDQTVHVGETATVNLTPYFDDPDGDALTYTASSSNSGVAGVSVSGSNVTITAAAAGSATITITARDPGGLTATQRTSVTVTQTNRAPRPRGTIPADTLAPGATATINASAYFTDPDGDVLTYTARSSNTGVARVSVSGSTVTITAVAAGSATITITARDPGGLTATQRASVTVTQTNRAPQPRGTIPAVTLAPGATATINASAYFTDPDGDVLAYTARSSNTGVARVSVSGSTVTITAVAAGSATITITARDPGGLTATQRFEVTVEADDDPFEELEGLVIGDDGSVRLTADNVTFGVGNGGCLNNPGIINGKRWEFHWTAWQRDVGSGWTNVSGTRRTGRLCGYDLTSASAGKYRLVGDMTIAGVRDLYRSKNTVTVDGGGGQGGFRDDFNSSASLDDWEIANATAEVSNGVLELTSSSRIGLAARAVQPPVEAWTLETRMGRERTDNSLVNLRWATSHPRYTLVDFVIGALQNTNYSLWAYDSQQEEWAYAEDLSGNSTAINDGAGELTTIGLSFIGGRIKGVAGSTELFDIDTNDLFDAIFARVRAVGLVSEGATGRTVLFDWIDVDGEAVSNSLLGDESPELQLIDMRELTRKAPGINLPSVKSRAGRGEPRAIPAGVAAPGPFPVPAVDREDDAMNEAAAPLRKAFSARREGAAAVLALATVRSGAPALAQESRAPEPAGSISPRTITAGQSASFVLTPYTGTPTADELAYAATVSDAAVATVSVSDSILTIAGLAPGPVVVTVFASDPGGLSVFAIRRGSP